MPKIGPQHLKLRGHIAHDRIQLLSLVLLRYHLLSLVLLRYHRAFHVGSMRKHVHGLYVTDRDLSQSLTFVVVTSAEKSPNDLCESER